MEHIPIKDINRMNNTDELVIKGRVKTNPKIIHFSNNRTQNGQRFAIDIFDNTGQIRIIAFNEDAAQNIKYFEEGKIVKIKHALVLKTNPLFNKTHEYEVKLNHLSVVEIEENDESIDRHPKCTSLLDVVGLSSDSIIDVVGVCSIINDIVDKNSPSKGEHLKLREIYIIDSSLTEVSVTLWNNNATQFTACVGDVLHFINVKVTDFQGGRKLSMTTNSQLELNPSWEIFLKNWYATYVQDNSQECMNISQPLFASQSSVENVHKVTNKNLINKILLNISDDDKKLKQEMESLDNMEKSLKQQREELSFKIKRLKMEKELIIEKYSRDL